MSEQGGPRAAMASGGVRISVIVPAHENGNELRDCLAALGACSYRDAEVIVVDDASADDTPSVAALMGARVFRLGQNSGPAAARNHGARHARGDILFFIDADVVVPPETLGRVAALFEARRDLTAVFGSYDARPRAGGLVSQYRNLLHHFVHQHGRPQASTFWAGCGAIRRAVFEELGGFDAARFRRASIEDIELGYRLRRAGHRILLDKTLQGTHLKRWTLWSAVTTDIFRRALPWSRLILESGNAPDDLNLRRSQRLSSGLVGLSGLFLALAPLRVELVGASLAAVTAVVVLNRELFAFFARQRGLVFAAACVPLHLLYYLYSGLAYVWVWTGFRVTRRAGRARRLRGRDTPAAGCSGTLGPR